MIHKEHILQAAVVGFVGKAVAVPHVFASHDRTQPRSQLDHVFQARRGIRRSWPDTELLLDGGRTFRCELKRPGVQLDEDSQQSELLTLLSNLGHTSFWANSVMMYGQQCERFGVPLKANWRTVAHLADEYVAAEIRKQEGKVKKVSPDVQMIKPRPKPENKRSPNQIMKFEAARMRSLP